MHSAKDLEVVLLDVPLESVRVAVGFRHRCLPGSFLEIVAEGRAVYVYLSERGAGRLRSAV